MGPRGDTAAHRKVGGTEAESHDHETTSPRCLEHWAALEAGHWPHRLGASRCRSWTEFFRLWIAEAWVQWWRPGGGSWGRAKRVHRGVAGDVAERGAQPSHRPRPQFSREPFTVLSPGNSRSSSKATRSIPCADREDMSRSMVHPEKRKLRYPSRTSAKEEQMKTRSVVKRNALAIFVSAIAMLSSPQLNSVLCFHETESVVKQ